MQGVCGKPCPNFGGDNFRFGRHNISPKNTVAGPGDRVPSSQRSSLKYQTPGILNGSPTRPQPGPARSFAEYALDWRERAVVVQEFVEHGQDRHLNVFWSAIAHAAQAESRMIIPSFMFFPGCRKEPCRFSRSDRQ